MPEDQSPGPGAYTIHDPYNSIQKPVFGSGSQINKIPTSCAPPPGTYSFKSTLTKREMTMSGRPDGKRPSRSPAVGAYTPGYTQVHASPPRVNMNMNERRENSESFKTKSWRTGAPDPGIYEPAKQMGQNLVLSRSAPSFAFKSRGTMHKKDESLGPVLTQFSSFSSRS